jgi:hypothetical protein
VTASLSCCVFIMLRYSMPLTLALRIVRIEQLF